MHQAVGSFAVTNWQILNQLLGWLHADQGQQILCIGMSMPSFTAMQALTSVRYGSDLLHQAGVASIQISWLWTCRF